MYRLIGYQSKLTTENTLLCTGSILKQLWTNGISSLRIAAKSSIEIL